MTLSGRVQLRHRHKAQRQLVGDQALDQPFGVRNIALPALPRAIRLGLGQMQRARPPSSAVPLLGHRLPGSFEGGPHRLPVLRRRFHHDFFGLFLDQPRGEQAQLRWRAAELAALEREFADDFDV
ncbi:MAG: hypothetical protein DMF89_26845 [Acidobacteria bacterium]|nr:MAG: hypothetical protein DMF89_26845 [Acidobacteriota bacterium]